MNPKASATFVLIHGGGSTAWDWHLVSPVLRELGHEAIAVDLPFEEPANGVRDDRLFPPSFTHRHARERLGIAADDIDGGHMIALARPKALAERLHRSWTELD
jgi:pimeloyl-ACP methyl ester carboxylesterase